VETWGKRKEGWTILKDSNLLFYFRYCEEYFNNGKYNFSVLEWAVKEIVEEDKKRKEEE
jgi:hypothetical protein